MANQRCLRIRSTAFKMLEGNAGIVTFFKFQYRLGTEVSTFDNTTLRVCSHLAGFVQNSGAIALLVQLI